MFGTQHISGIYNLFSCRRKPNPDKQGLVESATPPPLPPPPSPHLRRYRTGWDTPIPELSITRDGVWDVVIRRSRAREERTFSLNNTVDLLPWRGRLIQGLRWSGKAGGGCRRRNGRCRCAAGAALAATLRRCRRAGDGGRSGWARLQRGN